MEPEFEFPLRLPEPGSRKLLRELHAQLRTAILDGRLRAGVRLPTTRAFARHYGVSRNTATAAYERLASEGYVLTRGKAGTYVAALLPRASVQRQVPLRAAQLNPSWARWAAIAPVPDARYDFQVGVPDTQAFPWGLWRRLCARVLRRHAAQSGAYATPQGQPALRAAIAQHVSFARAVSGAPDDIVVTAGAQQAFDLLARTLVTPGRTVVAVENPGYPPARLAFAAAGAKIATVPVDAEGLVVERVPAQARVIYVTASHQFPLGPALSARRRIQLLEFARRHRAVVIEDDYDGEFRYAGRALDALQTLDRQASVFYVGTFSKSLFPALRLGYIVSPQWARAALVAAKRNADWHCPLAEQETLAAFILEGHLARYVRKMRRIYAARRELLLQLLARDFRRWLQPLPAEAGLHLCAWCAGCSDLDALIARARELDVGIRSLRGFQHGGVVKPALMFGYGAIDRADIAQGLARLRRVFSAGVRQ
jgi:GntR family transcriptional regulator/MocR family aminotransferase